VISAYEQACGNWSACTSIVVYVGRGGIVSGPRMSRQTLSPIVLGPCCSHSTADPCRASTPLLEEVQKIRTPHLKNLEWILYRGCRGMFIGDARHDSPRIISRKMHLATILGSHSWRERQQYFFRTACWLCPTFLFETKNYISSSIYVLIGNYFINCIDDRNTFVDLCMSREC
jgi:hypothetical protein